MVVTNLFENQPATIVVGTKIKGKIPVYVNGNVQKYEATDPETPYSLQATGQRLMLADLSIGQFLYNIDNEMLEIFNENEVNAIMKRLDCYDDIEAWRDMRLAQIHAYDSGASVNSFSINDVVGWFDKNTRVGLVNMYQLFQKSGSNDALPLLWVGGNAIEFNTADEVLEVLAKIEMYAAQCYAVTQRMKTSVNSLCRIGDLDGLKTFDFRSGYPPNLSF